MTGQGFVEFAHLESIQQNPDTYMTFHENTDWFMFRARDFMLMK